LLPPSPFRADRSAFATGPAGGFTLAELLTVIVIASLLLAATVPALEGITSSTRHTAGLRLLSGLLEEARARAIAEYATVYVVLDNPTPDRPHAALALYREPESGTGLPEALSPWHPLPGNITFHHSTGEGSPSSLFNAPASVRPTRTFPLAREETPRELPYLAFGPTGEVTAPTRSAYARILLAHRAASDPAAPITALEAFNISLFTGRASYETVPLPP